MALAKRALLLVFLLCLGCAAQSNTSASNPDLNRRIRNRIRAFYGNRIEHADLAVGPPKPSEFSGYDVVTVTVSEEGQHQDLDFLLSKDGGTLIRYTKLDLADPMQKIDLSGRPVRGNASAKVLVVNYDDLQCPYCAVMHQGILDGVLKSYGDRIKLVYKDYPLPFHPWAVHAAIDANCLAAQNPDAYWSFADYVHTNLEKIQGPRSPKKPLDAQIKEIDQATLDQAAQHKLDGEKLAACMKASDRKSIDASIKEGDSLGVDGTPTMFVNGERVDGAKSPEELRRVLDRALRDAGEPVPAAPAEAPAAPARK